MVSVTFRGTVTDDVSGVDTVRFTVEDEYGRVQPAGIITPDVDGRFTATVRLEASRLGGDRNGRRYVMRVTATDRAGNGASAAAAALVPHDRR